jgi:hypothetical protein
MPSNADACFIAFDAGVTSNPARCCSNNAAYTSIAGSLDSAIYIP